MTEFRTIPIGRLPHKIDRAQVAMRILGRVVPWALAIGGVIMMAMSRG